MTLRRLVLSILTIFAIALIGSSLIHSWNQPQVQNQLELYQTNLILHASEWQSGETIDSNLVMARKTLVGVNPVETVLKSYLDTRQSVQANLETLLKTAGEPSSAAATPETKPTSRKIKRPTTDKSIRELRDLANQLDLKIGILHAQQSQMQAAIASWNGLLARVQQPTPTEEATEAIAGIDAIDSTTASLLIGLWSQPPRLMPEAEQWISEHLDGWFRYKTLTRLYELQQRQDMALSLQLEEQRVAQRSLQQLLAVSVLPILGSLLGIGLLIFLLLQRLAIGDRAILAQNGSRPFPIPWDWEMIWQVGVGCFLFVGQFLVGQILVPVTFQLFQLNADGNQRTQAFSVLIYYILVALGVILAIYWSVETYLPLPEGTLPISLRGKWLWWGIGGYCVALPLVILVSFINQKIWQGQGGSNPILPIALEEKDPVALGIFFATAAIAAPLFEEFFFRGFLLASLSRYLPMGGAIALSGVVFAVVHLSVSEILPLTVLGMVLGFVYTRSRNLLAPMVLHSLWNSGTLISLLILGSSPG